MSIVDVTVNECQKRRFKKLGIDVTMSDGLYEGGLKTINIEPVTLASKNRKSQTILFSKKLYKINLLHKQQIRC